MGTSPGVELRRLAEGELTEWYLTAMLAFGLTPPVAVADARSAHFEPLRSIVGLDGGRMVATSGNLSLGLAVPGGRQVPMAGVTAVTVRSSHRRRGILNRMMAELLDDAVEHGEPLAGLIASEAPIYGRFGFGAAVFGADVTLDRHLATFEPPLEPAGAVVLELASDVVATLEQVWDRWWPTCPGEVSRSTGFWQARLGVDTDAKPGATARLAALHHGPGGDVDGYALYRVVGHAAPDGRPHGRVEAEAIVALTPEAHLELWAYLLGVDLVREVHAAPVALDDPLRHRLLDLRQLRTGGVVDRLWLRLLDIPACLTARSYRGTGRLTLGVRDEFRPATAGTYELDASPEGSTCDRATGADPDLVLSVADLSAVCLGGVRVTELAAAGRVVEATVGAAGLADRLFAADRLPFCATVF